MNNGRKTNLLDGSVLDLFFGLLLVVLGEITYFIGIRIGAVRQFTFNNTH